MENSFERIWKVKAYSRAELDNKIFVGWRKFKMPVKNIRLNFIHIMQFSASKRVFHREMRNKDTNNGAAQNPVWIFNKNRDRILSSSCGGRCSPVDMICIMVRRDESLNLQPVEIFSATREEKMHSNGRRNGQRNIHFNDLTRTIIYETRRELLLDDVEILVHYSMVVIYSCFEIEKFVFVLCWEDKINLKGQRSEYRWPVDETYIILHLRWIQFHLGWVMVVNFLG